MPRGENISYRIGAIMGMTAIWPLIIIGLFSISRRFRTNTTRLTILLVIWSFAIMGHLGTIIKTGRQLATVNQPQTAEPQATSAASPVNVPVTALATVKPASTASLPGFDFSPGSDQRLIALIDGAQRERYLEISAAYARICELRPDDAVVALERVVFIERFAYSEEVAIEEATADHEVALAYLDARFPQAPGTVLYHLRHAYGEKRESLAADYAKLTAQWTPADRAAFLLLRASALESAGGQGVTAIARESFALNPTVEAGLLLARKTEAEKQNEECLQVLMNPVFDQAEAWSKRQKLELLLKIEQAAPAVLLYEELVAAGSEVVQDAEVATGLARIGKVELARQIFAVLATQDWNRESNSLRRFAFELEHGNAAEAQTAYRAMREDRFSADPFLRYRLALFWKHPSTDWTSEDLGGAVFMLTIAAMMGLLPLAIILPVHYWSLLREKKGKIGGWPDARWGLWHVWLTLGLVMLGNFTGLWFLEAEMMRSWAGGAEVASVSLDRPSLLLVQTINWLVLGGVLFCLLRCGKDWALLGSGRWSPAHSLGLGIVWVLLLRGFVGVYVTIFPQVIAGEWATISQTKQMCVELLATAGPLGMLAVLSLVVPLLEEVMFRGVLLQALGRHVPFGWANTIQATTFALVHENFGLFPFYFLLGFTCGELTRRSGGLLPALIVHAANNLIAGIGFLSLQRVAS